MTVNPSNAASIINSMMKKVEAPPVCEAAQKLDPDDFVKIVSKEGHEFLVYKECAKVSKLMKNFLENKQGVTEKEIYVSELDGSIHCRSLSAPLLEKTIQYFYHKYRYDNDPEHRPEFNVPYEMAIELIQVATQMQC